MRSFCVHNIILRVLPILALIDGPVRAEFIGPLNSSGGIDFSVKSVGADLLGAPVFGPFGQLLSPGNGYPLLGDPIGAVQAIGGGITAPAASIAPPGLFAVANPSAVDTGQFGSGLTQLDAQTFPGGAGVLWNNFFVSDA